MVFTLGFEDFWSMDWCSAKAPCNAIVRKVISFENQRRTPREDPEILTKNPDGGIGRSLIILHYRIKTAVRLGGRSKFGMKVDVQLYARGTGAVVEKFRWHYK